MRSKQRAWDESMVEPGKLPPDAAFRPIHRDRCLGIGKGSAGGIADPWPVICLKAETSPELLSKNQPMHGQT